MRTRVTSVKAKRPYNHITLKPKKLKLAKLHLRLYGCAEVTISLCTLLVIYFIKYRNLIIFASENACNKQMQANLLVIIDNK